eukprot:4443081-Alexandrium_andersonii.AAC.1
MTLPWFARAPIGLPAWAFIGFQASLSALPSVPPVEALRLIASLLRLHGGMTKARAEAAAAGECVVLAKEQLRLK